MEHEGDNNSRAKSIPALTMQEYAHLVSVNVNENGVVSNNNNSSNVPLAVPLPPIPDPIPSGNGNGNPNPNNNVDPQTNNNASPPPPPDAPEQRAAAREQDLYLPVANVLRIMRRILPSHAKISDGAKETVQECVSEYISFITGEANDRCRREQRRTVTAEDILWAMSKLGFDDYLQPLTLYLNRYRELESERNVGPRELPVAGKRRASEYPPLVPVVTGSAYNASSPLASYPMSPGMYLNPAPVGGGSSAPPNASNAGASGASTSGEQDNGGLMVSDFEEFAQFK